MDSQVWNLVLAAGAGRRLAPITGSTPKQFWSPNGGPSLLEETFERLQPIAPANRTVTVVDWSHRPFVESLPASSRLGHVVYQPQDRGTAAGVLLGLTNILLKAPEAIVVMTPSDHGVTSRTIFLAGIRMAGQAVKCGMSSVVLFGVEPDHACSDYGWIVPSSGESPRHLGAVTGFVEKPNATVATRLLDQGAVWNTMVLVARVSSLVQLFSRHLPDLASTFDAACGLPAAERDRFLETAYAEMPRADFSHDLLSRANGLSLMVWPKAMGWSDLGTPDRLIEWETRRRTPRSHETPQPAAHAQCA